MRILVCNFEYPPLGGGGGVATAHLAAELARRHAVTVLTSGALGLPASETVPGGVRVVRVQVPFRRQAAVASLRSMAAFMVAGRAVGRRLMAADAYDVVNTHFVLPSGPVGDALARRAGRPHVLSVHGGDLFDPTKRTSPHRHATLRAWVRRLLARADVVVGQSTNTLDNMRRYYTRSVPALQIPLGIPSPPVHPAPRARYGCGPGDVILVTVGRLVARKAVHQLIAVMEGFRGQAVRLLVIGSGPQGEALAAQVQERRLEAHVRFLGPVPDGEKFGVLAMADVYVSASQHEGFGLVFLEAMASGLPVVCYDHGGQSDFLRDEVTGFLVPVNDLGRLAHACHTLASDPRRRAGLAATARQEAAHFSIDRCAAAYEAAFEHVIRDAAAARATHARAAA